MKKKQNKLLNAIAMVTATGMILLSSCAKEHDQQPMSAADSEVGGKAANSLLFAPSATMFGKTRAEWATEFTKWMLTKDCNHFPGFDTTGALIGQDQSGSVFFLSGRRNYNLMVTVPHDAAIFIPLLSLWDWYPNTTNNRMPLPGQSPEVFLDSLGHLYNNDIGACSITIDGVEIANIQEQYKLVAPIFSITANADLANCYYPGLTGSPQLQLVSGSWVMLKPLSPGIHTIVRKGTFRGFLFQYNYQINQL